MRKPEKRTVVLDKNMRGGGDNWQRIPGPAEGGGHGGRGNVLRARGTDRCGVPGVRPHPVARPCKRCCPEEKSGQKIPALDTERREVTTKIW